MNTSKQQTEEIKMYEFLIRVAVVSTFVGVVLLFKFIKFLNAPYYGEGID